MADSLETIEKKGEDGLDWIITGIYRKVGQVRAAERKGAVYSDDVEAMAAEVEGDIRGAYRRYLDLVALEPDVIDPAEATRRAQGELGHMGADEARPVADPAEERRRAAEEETITCELAVECDRVKMTDIRAAVIRRPDGVLCIAVEGAKPEAWAIEREAPRVLGALRQLPDGAGDEQVRAILCQVEVQGEPTAEEQEAEADRFYELADDGGGECERLEAVIAGELNRLGLVKVAEFGVYVRPLEGALWAHIDVDNRSIRIQAARAVEVLGAIKEEDPAPPDASHLVAEALAAMAPSDPPRVPAPVEETFDLATVEGCNAIEGRILAELERLGLNGDVSAWVYEDGDPMGTAEFVHNDVHATLQADDALGVLRGLQGKPMPADVLHAITEGLPAAEGESRYTDEAIAGIEKAIGAVRPGGAAPDDQDEAEGFDVEQAIGAEMTRCGADGVEVSCDFIDDVATLTSSEWTHHAPAAEVLDALRALPDDAGEGVVRARLLGAELQAEGDRHDPSTLDARRELDRCGATEIAIDSIGDDGLTLYLRRLGRGHGERCELTAAQVCAALAEQPDGLGTALAWGFLRAAQGDLLEQGQPEASAELPPVPLAAQFARLALEGELVFEGKHWVGGVERVFLRRGDQRLTTLTMAQAMDALKGTRGMGHGDADRAWKNLQRAARQRAPEQTSPSNGFAGVTPARRRKSRADRDSADVVVGSPATED